MTIRRDEVWFQTDGKGLRELNVPEEAPAAIPAWAKAIKYEYDLGMSTSCEVCGEDLKENATVYKDTECEGRGQYYCSPACARKADTA